MKYFSIVYSLLLSASVMAKGIDIPKEWWQEKVTIDSVERASKEWLKSQLADAEARGFPKRCESAGRTKSGLNLPKLECFTETKEETKKKWIEKLQSQAQINSDKWKKLKATYRKGDEIYSFRAPTGRARHGYILVRNGKIIYIDQPPGN